MTLRLGVPFGDSALLLLSFRAKSRNLLLYLHRFNGKKTDSSASLGMTGFEQCGVEIKQMPENARGYWRFRLYLPNPILIMHAKRGTKLFNVRLFKHPNIRPRKILL